MPLVERMVLAWRGPEKSTSCTLVMRLRAQRAFKTDTAVFAWIWCMQFSSLCMACIPPELFVMLLKTEMVDARSTEADVKSTTTTKNVDCIKCSTRCRGQSNTQHMISITLSLTWWRSIPDARLPGNHYSSRGHDPRHWAPVHRTATVSNWLPWR